jgi:SAM-dependent methyltransferase
MEIIPVEHPDYFDVFDETQTPAWGILQVLRKDMHIKGLEIGCDVGHSTLTFLKNTTSLDLWGIDPYEGYVDWNGVHLDNENRQACKKEMLRRIGNHSGRFTLVEKPSDDAVNDFEDDFFDFVFIDGDHSYEQVIKDIRNYYPKLKPGGLFCGHDLQSIEGVNRAVSEFTQEINIQQVYLLPNDVWCWQKNVD